jgi:hypothetical protein
MVQAAWAELEHCGKVILPILAVSTPFLPFMGRRWPGRVVSVCGWLIFIILLFHALGG